MFSFLSPFVISVVNPMVPLRNSGEGRAVGAKAGREKEDKGRPPDL